MKFHLVECAWCTELVHGKQVATVYFPALAWKRRCFRCGSVPENPIIVTTLDLTVNESMNIEDKQYLVFLRNEERIQRLEQLFNHYLQLE